MIIYLFGIPSLQLSVHGTVPRVLLSKYGIKGKILNWISDFLIGRKQRVVVNGEQSELTDVTSGIPQGSVLGPILFLIFVNDLPDGVSNVSTDTIKLFADDTKLYREIQKPEDSQELQKDLFNVMQWSEKRQLPFNTSKCNVMHIGNTNPGNKFTMERLPNDVMIETVTEENDLGVTFDNELKFSKHIAVCVNKANQRVGLLRRNFKYLDKKAFITVYKSIVLPVFKYCSTVWYTMYKKDSELIEKVQRRATKLLPELKNLDYSTRLRKLNLPSLVYRRERADVLQIYRIIHGIDQIDCNMFFELEEGTITHGHSLKIKKVRVNNRRRQCALGVRAILTTGTVLLITSYYQITLIN